MNSITVGKLPIQIQAEKSDSSFSEDNMLDDIPQKYIDGKIARDNLIFFYLLSVLK